MKKTFFAFFWLTAFVAFNTKTYAQQNNTLSVIYGTGSANIVNAGIGAAGFKSEGQILFGLNYVHRLDRLFSIETGLEYSSNNLLWDYEDAYDPTFKPQKTNIKLLSVPVYGNFTFFKYLFLNAGFSVDFDTNHTSNSITPNESGIGVFLGIGGKYAFRHFSLLVNPFVQAHDIMSFSPSGGGILANSGVKFGVGYSF